MKFTSEDLMKAMGLQVGDRIKITYMDHNFTATDGIFEIKQSSTGMICLETECYDVTMDFLVDRDYEILPRPKRVGDLKCSDYKCTNCPIRIICNGEEIQKDLYEELEIFKKVTTKDEIFDQEIFDLLKARLDKVVE